jgi:hypothetical protein
VQDQKTNQWAALPLPEPFPGREALFPVMPEALSSPDIGCNRLCHPGNNRLAQPQDQQDP